MEYTQKFKTSLMSLQDNNLPVSKTKILEITRAAMQGIRVYKNIVQIVERFIEQCPSKYKLPSLYVIDSIVRYSRSEFRDRDYYGQRFIRNFDRTFHHLFSMCLPEDKPKIVRVLNLWQKNNVFPPDVIQPLLDLAHPTVPNINNDTSTSTINLLSSLPHKRVKENSSPTENDSHDNILCLDRMLSEASAAEKAFRRLSNTLNDGQQHKDTLAAQLQELAASLSHFKSNQEPILKDNQFDNESGNAQASVLFDSNDREEIDDDISTPTEAEPPYPKPSKMSKKMAIDEKTLNTFADLVQIIQQQQEQNSINDDEQSDQRHNMDHHGSSASESILHKFLNSSAIANASNVGSINHLLNDSPNNNNQQNSCLSPNMAGNSDRNSSIELYHQLSKRSRSSLSPSNEERHSRHNDKEYERHSSRHKYSSPSSSPRGDADRHHRNRSRRSRSGSRSTSSRTDAVDSEREKEERERLREKRRRGFPPVRKDYVTICSTTLWIGHLPKRTTSESDLHDLFGEFGVITSIDLIPSRGCAYVCMDRRQDAYKAFFKIKSQNKILGSTQVKLTWAPGKGIKNKENRDYWESDIGCSFIPHSILTKDKDIDLDQMEEGGVIDEDSMSETLKEIRLQKQKSKKEKELAEQQQKAALTTLIQAPASVPLIPMAVYPGVATTVPPPIPATTDQLLYLNAQPPAALPVPQPLNISGQYPSIVAPPPILPSVPFAPPPPTNLLPPPPLRPPLISPPNNRNQWIPNVLPPPPPPPPLPITKQLEQENHQKPEECKEDSKFTKVSSLPDINQQAEVYDQSFKEEVRNNNDDPNNAENSISLNDLKGNPQSQVKQNNFHDNSRFNSNEIRNQFQPVRPATVPGAPLFPLPPGVGPLLNVPNSSRPLLHNHTRFPAPPPNPGIHPPPPGPIFSDMEFPNNPPPPIPPPNDNRFPQGPPLPPPGPRFGNAGPPPPMFNQHPMPPPGRFICRPPPGPIFGGNGELPPPMPGPNFRGPGMMPNRFHGGRLPPPHRFWQQQPPPDQRWNNNNNFRPRFHKRNNNRNQQQQQFSQPASIEQQTIENAITEKDMGDKNIDLNDNSSNKNSEMAESKNGVEQAD